MKPNSIVDHLEGFVTRDFKPKPKPAPTPVVVRETKPQTVTISLEELRAIVQEEIALHEARRRLGVTTKGRVKQVEMTEVLPEPETIVRIIAHLADVPAGDLMGKLYKRANDIDRYRQIAYWMIRNLCQVKMVDVAKFLGRTHHATTIHALRRVSRTVNHPSFIQPEDNTVEAWAKALLEQHPIKGSKFYAFKDPGDRS